MERPAEYDEETPEWEVNPPALSCIRDLAGMTKSHLAVRAQISLQYLCDLEAGRRAGRNPQVRKSLATALHVPITAISRRHIRKVPA